MHKPKKLLIKVKYFFWQDTQNNVRESTMDYIGRVVNCMSLKTTYPLRWSSHCWYFSLSGWQARSKTKKIITVIMFFLTFSSTTVRYFCQLKINWKIIVFFFPCRSAWMRRLSSRPGGRSVLSKTVYSVGSPFWPTASMIFRSTSISFTLKPVTSSFLCMPLQM